jgi:septal ring factor EnvC (AmiA/AmiB activator)
MTDPIFLTGLIIVIGLIPSLFGAFALRLSQRAATNGRAAYAAAEAIQDDITRQLDRMTKRIEQLETENTRLQTRLDQAETEIDKLERDNARLTTAVRRLVTQIAAFGHEPDLDPLILQRLST